jgi:hypothetical protein
VGAPLLLAWLGCQGAASDATPRLDMAYLPAQQRVVVAVSLAGLARTASLSARAALTAEAGGPALREAELGRTDADVDGLWLDTRGLSPGRYVVRAELLERQRTLAANTWPLEIRARPDWLGNALGTLKPASVPPPFTPLQVRGLDVASWGRVYRFRDSLFPAEIHSGGAQILAAPMRLSAQLQGRGATSSPAEVRVTRASAQAVELVARSSLGELWLLTETRIEFDGFAWVRLRLLPQREVQLSRLALEVPLRPEHATLYNSDRQDGRGIGEARAGFSTGFDPVRSRVLGAWLGDEERGFHWSAQSDRNWRVAHPEAAIGYERRAGAVVLRVVFVDQPTRVSEATTFEFGFTATPVRPKPAGWRAWRFGSGDDKGAARAPNSGSTRFGPAGTNLAYGVSYWSRFPRSRYPEAAADAPARFEHLRSQGLEPLADASLLWTYPLGPEYRHFQAEWHPSPFAWPDLDAMQRYGGWLEYPACASAASFADFQISRLDRLIKALELRGIYFDMSLPCLNARAWNGVGFSDPRRAWPPLRGHWPGGYGPHRAGRRLIDELGRLHPESEILATRELMKRFYVLAKQHDPGFLILHHASGDAVAGLMSFVDAVLNGEQFRASEYPDVNYFRSLPLATFRAAFMGHNYGPAAVFLPEFSAKAELRGQDPAFWHSAAAHAQIRHLLGLALVHDAHVLPAYSAHEPYEQLRRAQDEFGQWDDAMEFRPYWKSSALVQLAPSTGDLVCSVFRGRPRLAGAPSRVMLVVLNNGDADRHATLTVDARALGAARLLRDLVRSQVFPLAQNGAARVFLPKRDFRILLLE